MKIKMLSAISGPAYSYGANVEAEFPDAEARRLIDAGLAVPIRSEAKETTAKRAPREKAAKD